MFSLVLISRQNPTVEGADCVFVMQLAMELLSPKSASKAIHASQNDLNLGFRGGLSRSEFHTALKSEPKIYSLLAKERVAVKYSSTTDVSSATPGAGNEGRMSPSAPDLDFGVQPHSGRKRGSLQAVQKDRYVRGIRPAAPSILASPLISK